MGYRLHCATAHKVEYGEGYFNHLLECVNKFLIEECPNAMTDDCGENILIPRDELIKAAESVESDEEYYQCVLDSEDDFPYSAIEFARILRMFAEESDKSDEFVHLCWF